MSYADKTEEQKEKAREACRRWAEKNDRSDYYREYDKSRPNKKERQEQAQEWARNNREKTREYNKAARQKQTKEYNMWWNARKRATLKGLPFDLEREDIVIPDACPCCSGSMAKPSIDQKRPGEGYTKANARIICFDCNVIKSYGTADRHRMIADWMDSED